MRNDGWRILVPVNLTGPSKRMALARVLARWYVLSQMPDDITTPDIDGISEAIVLPDDAVHVVVEQFGRDIEAIAMCMALPESVVANRLRTVSPPRSGLYPRLALA